jgi:hypothetical protein
MKIDYKEMARLVDIRMKQIYDASLEIDYFNKEYNELQKIRDSLTELILLERKNWEDFIEND